MRSTTKNHQSLSVTILKLQSSMLYNPYEAFKFWKTVGQTELTWKANYSWQDTGKAPCKIYNLVHTSNSDIYCHTLCSCLKLCPSTQLQTINNLNLIWSEYFFYTYLTTLLKALIGPKPCSENAIIRNLKELFTLYHSSDYTRKSQVTCELFPDKVM